MKDSIDSNIPKPPPVVGDDGGAGFKEAKSNIISSLKKDSWFENVVRTNLQRPVSRYTGLAGSNVYFAFDHMLVLTNTIVERLTCCRATTCAKGAKVLISMVVSAYRLEKIVMSLC